jgi:hypothetical protein
MEAISQLVDDSLARHRVETRFDHLRLQWSRWFRCESSFSVLLAPAKPGIFALGEEMISPAESMKLRAPALSGVEGSSPVGKRMLALFQITEADDLGMALGRLFLPGNPLRERLASGHSFGRYTVIEDPVQRSAAHKIFARWMQQTAESASGISSSAVDSCGAGSPARESIGSCGEDTLVREYVPSFPFAWGTEVQNREVPESRLHPEPLPSGF